MTLVRLVYASRFHDSKFNTSELARILDCATRNNPSLEVTGILAFGDDLFLQCLEGGREYVNQLYSKIAQDERHYDITLLTFNEIKEREFSDWSMKMVMLTEKNNKLMSRFSTCSKFDPFKMSGDSAFQLLRALKAA